ncbi:MAG TPA: hypothetical protein VFA89_05210 [Terriglobales bacterium]|nr:hypothetical protein [Terriglobales bacterium]
MGRLLLIDVVSAGVLLGIWYFCFARYNRRKGATVLRCLQVACGGKGRIVEFRWLGSSLLQASLQLPSRWFDHAKVTVRLLPRPLPIQWILGRWKKQKETLTFEANLGAAPTFRLDIFHHRWCGQQPKNLGPNHREWMISRPGPVVLTTREKWAHELNPVVNALLTTREKNFMTVRFHPDSPNFSATVDLDKLSDQHAAEGVMTVLLELAEGASAKQH